MEATPLQPPNLFPLIATPLQPPNLFPLIATPLTNFIDFRLPTQATLIVIKIIRQLHWKLTTVVVAAVVNSANSVNWG